MEIITRTPLKWEDVYVKLELIVIAGDPLLFSYPPPQAREELRPVREDFEAKNKQLLDEMPKFYHSRIDYFQPSFEALIRAQVSDSPLQMHKQWGT